MNSTTIVGTAGLLATIICAADLLAATEGVKGTTVRPVQEDANTRGCRIAKPGEYLATVGDLIELDYTHPSIPAVRPKKVGSELTGNGAIIASPLGTRLVPPSEPAGTDLRAPGPPSTIAFYFEARQAGEDEITLTIDGKKYVYKFKVSK